MNREKALHDITELMKLENINPRYMSDKIMTMDWRDEYEKKIDYYIGIFCGGAIRKDYTHIDKSSAHNRKPKEIKDVRHYCEKFIAEDFVHVQKPFWEYYKMTRENIDARCGWVDHNGVNHSVRYTTPVTSKEIYDTIKEIKDGKKTGKETNQA